ncbi:MAG: methylated-DNA--[protein]-cysteine S-methyltransferase [Myxococcales bacterium]|nr:methylated-DNA--[protein]-cysteine S-methyltransferase [Myxococcales bacterium]MCB9531729.1 methylated-DNA--[protein]-cysteine S-methyltransferase [Myxococcales bacterium]MCB9534104.1 methylated-DNA--[protein]-cysteine S-methyltransferase [Myxococcales bacterium]
MGAGPTRALWRESVGTPIGPLTLLTDDDGAVWALEWEDREARMFELLRRQRGGAGIELRTRGSASTARAAVEAYFGGQPRVVESIALSVAGTEFQRLVWSALQSIPVGSTVSYGALAERLAKPRAVRAVGLANGQNPIAIIVPCHRVIGADGALTGYAGGLERKRWLLAHETGLSSATAASDAEPAGYGGSPMSPAQLPLFGF